jgi:hypothetical protein
MTTMTTLALARAIAAAVLEQAGHPAAEIQDLVPACAARVLCVLEDTDTWFARHYETPLGTAQLRLTLDES